MYQFCYKQAAITSRISLERGKTQLSVDQKIFSQTRVCPPKKHQYFASPIDKRPVSIEVMDAVPKSSPPYFHKKLKNMMMIVVHDQKTTSKSWLTEFRKTHKLSLN